MLLVEPRFLIDKLGPVCRRAFERAAGAAVTARHREVTVEHVLAALLDDRESDMALILEQYRVDQADARAALHGYLAMLSASHSGRPVFSPTLLEWLEDAWLYASAELGESSLRSGALLVRLLVASARYTTVALDGFETLPRDELRQTLTTMTAHTPESADSRAPDAATDPRDAGQTALSRFTTNLTERAKRGELDPVVGRDAEVRQVVDILCRRRKNNPILVGEPGVGKTALVEALASRIARGEIPEALANAQIAVLDLGLLQAGAGVKGELEKRLQSVVAEVKASPSPIILFIDEAHTLVGAGGPQGGGDAANLLKPALARGELRTIAATTWSEFKRYFEKDAALERRFQPVKVDEPSPAVSVVMLRDVARRLEEAHGVVIRDEAVRAAVTLSSRYITGRRLPDKAVDLLDTAAARVKVLRGAPPSVVEDVRAELSAISSRLDAIQRDEIAGAAIDERARSEALAAQSELETKLAALEDRLKSERGAIGTIDSLRASLASGNSSDRAELKHALDALREVPVADRLVYADVDEAIIGAIVSDWTGIPVGRMLKDDVDAMLGLETRLRARVRGQDQALAVIARELRSARSGLKAANAPLGVFLLVGPSGVGKTETALGLADALFGGERFVVTINMSEFQERHTVSRLIGSPPGYVGYGEGGVLTEAVRQRPYSVVLLDEVEKADRDVMNLFYQVFDKGTLADGEGRVIDFANTVVVMTSNLATDLLTRAADPEASTTPSEDDLVALVKPTLSTYFKPALLARMTVVPYVPIRKEALAGIVDKKLREVADRAREAHAVEVVVDEAVNAAITARCRDVESGARNVDHILRGVVLPRLSSAILGGLADEEKMARIRVGIDATGSISCTSEGA